MFGIGARAAAPSVRRRLILLVASLLVPALATAGLTTYFAYDSERAMVGKHLAETARALSLVVDRQLGQAEAALFAFAQSPYLDTGDYAAVDAQVRHALRLADSWVVIEEPGRQVVNTFLPADASLPAVGTQDHWAGLESDRVTVSNLFVGIAAQKPTVAQNLLVERAGRRHLLAILTAASGFNRILTDRNLPSGWIGVILDRDGVVVARSRDPERYVGRPAARDLVERLRDGEADGLFESVTFDGVEVVAALSRSTVSGWSFVVGVPKADLARTARRSTCVLLIVGGLLLVVGAVFATSISRSIARPIEALAAGAVAPQGDALATSSRTRLREVDLVAGALREAEQANRAKTQFLAAMSHEIRTPLHGIMGLTSLILERPDLNADLRRQIEQIEVSGSALLTVVNDVLDFSKIEAGAIELDPKPFSPLALIEDCAAIVRALAEAKWLIFTLRSEDALPDRLVGDEPRLRQILLNLLNNAIKFTPVGQIELELTCEAVSKTHDRLRFAVADTGIGIAESERTRLFERFSQLDSSTSRRYGGTGLGLAISKQLVELMGGEIGVESEPGCGSTFWFTVTLPRASVADAGAHDGARAADHGRASGRILLAEDLELNQEIAKAVLEKAGYAVDVVANGAEALWAVQKKTYDLVLMDVQMPVMDGIRATQAIRALPEPAGAVPIVAMTANVFTEQIASFKEAGMNDHVGKPFKHDELYAAIDRWLRRT